MESNRNDSHFVANKLTVHFNIGLCLCLLWPYGSECMTKNRQKMSGKWQTTNHVRTKSTTRNLLYNDYHRNQRVKSSSLVLLISFCFWYFLLLFVCCFIYANIRNFRWRPFESSRLKLVKDTHTTTTEPTTTKKQHPSNKLP